MLEPGIDFAREGLDSAHGLLVLEKPGLSHDQQMSESADVVVHLLDLAEDLIRRAGEHDAGLDRVLHGCVGSVRCMLVDRRAAQDLRMHRRRHVTWRIAKMQRHLVRRHVPEKLLGARARLGLALGSIEQRRIGEPVDRHLVAAAGVAPALAVGGVDRRRAAISGEERRT
jgi:hypothetical protein